MSDENKIEESFDNNSKVVNDSSEDTLKNILIIVGMVVIIIGGGYFLKTYLDSDSFLVKDSFNNINNSSVDASTNKTINIKDSHDTYNTTNHVTNTTNVVNDPNFIEKLTNEIKNKIEENRELKSAIELFLGKDYESFLDEQKKSNKPFISYLSRILEGKSIFEIVGSLKKEKEKRENIFKELDELMADTKDENQKAILIKAKEKLKKFRFNDYQKLLDEYQNNIAGDVVQNKNLAKIYYLKAIEYYDRLEYKQARESMQEAVALDNENPLYLNAYGYYLHDLGQYNEATKHFEKALEVDLKNFGKSHPNTARDYNNIGSIYHYLAKYNKAIDYYSKALAIDLKNFGDNHPQIATYYNNLGEAFRAKGEYDKAIEYYSKALAIDLKNFGDNHHNVAIRYNNLGSAYTAKGEYDKAIEHYNKALAIDLKNFDENHPNIATYYNNLGEAFRVKGEYDKAIEHYNKALAIIFKNLGEIHPYIAGSYNNLGLAYYSKKDYNKALEYFEKSLKIYRDVFKDESHPYIKNTKINLEYAKRFIKR